MRIGGVQQRDRIAKEKRREEKLHSSANSLLPALIRLDSIFT